MNAWVYKLVLFMTVNFFYCLKIDIISVEIGTGSKACPVVI